jgi:hypothetical protein
MLRDLESVQSLRIFGDYLHTGDYRAPRARAAPRDHLIYSARLTFEDRLDPPVGPVSNPPGQP